MDSLYSASKTDDTYKDFVNVEEIESDNDEDYEIDDPEAAKLFATTPEEKAEMKRAAKFMSTKMKDLEKMNKKSGTKDFDIPEESAFDDSTDF